MDTLRVLVVDDEMGMRLGVERVLRDLVVSVSDINVECGFQTEQADTGEDGLDMIRANPPDIMLLDYKLPNMTGLELLAALKPDEKENMLIIMITAYATIEAAVSATKLGTYDFLAKPFTPAELRSTMKKASTRLMLAREARRLAEERRQVRFEFIRVLGHELKAPLGAVEGYLNILADKTLGEEINAYDQMVNRSRTRLQQMRRLITDLLDMTRIDSGEKTRELSPLDIRAIAEHAIEAQAVVAQKNGISIELDAPESLVMTCDTTEMEIVFNNLISNAVKYNRENGNVTVKLSDQSAHVTIAVSDTGIGMSKEEVDKLFGEFVRIKNKRTKNIMGTGLGLSILKRIASLYDGRIDVVSEPEVGTTFSVVLSKSADTE